MASLKLLTVGIFSIGALSIGGTLITQHYLQEAPNPWDNKTFFIVKALGMQNETKPTVEKPNTNPITNRCVFMQNSNKYYECQIYKIPTKIDSLDEIKKSLKTVTYNENDSVFVTELEAEFYYQVFFNKPIHDNKQSGPTHEENKALMEEVYTNTLFSIMEVMDMERTAALFELSPTYIYKDNQFTEIKLTNPSG